MQPQVGAYLVGHVPVEGHPHLVDDAPPAALGEGGHVNGGAWFDGGDAVQGSFHRADVVLVRETPPALIGRLIDWFESVEGWSDRVFIA